MRQWELHAATAGALILAGSLWASASAAEAQGTAPPATLSGPLDLSPLPPLPPPVLWPEMPPVLPPGGQGASGWEPVEPGQPPVATDLPQFISALQQALDLLRRWVEAAQQAASGTLTRLIWESPGSLPQGAGLPDLIGELGALPDELRGTLQAVLAKLQMPVRPGSIDARHQAYTGSSPALSHEALGIAETDAVVAGGAVQEDAASRATALAAAALARDPQLPAAVAATHETGRALAGAARGLPSARAGIELLVAGMGSGLEQQADFSAAIADRLTILSQQTAQVSQQIGSLATTAGALTLREAERDRQGLDARLGLADAAGRGARMLEDMLAGAGAPPADEMRLDPLY